MRELATLLVGLKDAGATADDVRDQLKKIALRISKKQLPRTNF
jgi:hypothetical protein